MAIRRGMRVIRLSHTQRNMPRLMWPRWNQFRMGRCVPGRLRLKHFGRKIIEGIKNCISFHKWRARCCAGVIPDWFPTAGTDVLSAQIFGECLKALFLRSSSLATATTWSGSKPNFL